MKMKSIVTIATMVLFAGLTSTGCTRGGKSDKDTLTIALASSPNTLDPRFATDANGMRISSLLFSSIVRLGPDLKIVGEAADSWEYKDGAYTFQLRPGLTFSNGRPVTAADISFSIDEYRSSKSPFHSAYKMIDSVEVKYDEQQRYVKLALKEFSATLLTDLSPLKILPKEMVERTGEDFGKTPVGSGSFELISQSANEIVLKARDGHSYASPQMKQVTFKIIRDDNTRFLKTLKGEIDIAQSEIPPVKIAELEKKGDFQIHKYPGLSMTYVLLNLKDPVLKQLPFRQALSQAINRQDIITYKLDGMAQPATSILTPANPFFHSGLQNPVFNLEAAKAVVKKMGLEGKELTLKTSNTQAAVENGKVLANQLQSAGLNVKLQSYEWGTFYGDIQKGNFQMATMKWVGATDPDIYRIGLHSQELPPGRNRGHYINKDLDKRLEDGLKMTDEAARIQHYMQVQKMVHDDLPILPLWYDMEVAVVHKRVKNYVPPKNGDFSGIVSVTKE